MLFTNLGDAATAFLATVIALELALFGNKTIFFVVLVIAFLCYKMKQIQYTMICLVFASFIWKLEPEVWPLIAICLWGGCLLGNLFWEMGGNQLITHLFHLSSPLPNKAPGMLNWGIAIVLFLILYPLTEGGILLFDFFEDVIDEFLFLELWQQIIAVIAVIAIIAIIAIIAVRNRSRRNSDEGEENIDYGPFGS